MNEHPENRPASPSEQDALRESRRHTRRSFLAGLIAAAAGYGGWRWLMSQPDADGIPQPFRSMLGLNERLAEGYFRPARLAREYPPSAAAVHRTNGDLGLLSDLDLSAWRLRVEELAAGPAILSIADILALPSHSQTTELNCIEGWTNITTWTGARFVDFLRRYPPKTAP
jgi:DMSO/TMAO reductase YedYZ molybdopterin-dependent catalytic subunit